MNELPDREPGAALRAIHEARPVQPGGVNLFDVPAGEVTTSNPLRLAYLRLVRGGVNDPELAA
ncbi:hypothetical protein SRB17_86820 [Streptomyces sp. RB17]|uniref:hypothetical protein n=1 Tax=Streptomyces sp. RB17 TaxID=2585197 RepID=UPI001294AD8A|nr:hypothetical protein [Streptomyces sp. RB17]MQY40649.1 hypothetical protein [Streptomyces sp. RB17]